MHATQSLKLNGSGWVTIGKLLSQQDLPLEQITDEDGKKIWPSYGADSEQLKAVVKELDTDHFTCHDDGVKGYLDLVDEWTKLVCQTGSHDGYKGENPGDPNNGSVRAYHLDGAIDVCKVTFQYGNGTEDVVRYYPESNGKKTIRVIQPAALFR